MVRILRDTPARPALDRLGLYGLRTIEDALLAGLVTGDPILLVGGPGSAKTLLARRLAEALRLRFHAYDASKALFEDMIGFPNPGALAQGRVEYAPTPLSISDKEFVLVDEISRAAPATANKWLEVIRSRTVMGLPLPRLRHVMAAMNPPGMLGTHPLDLALADRFAFLVRMPEACDMEPADLRRVAAAHSSDDGAALGRNGTAAAPRLDRFLRTARRRYENLEGRLDRELGDYLVALSACLQNARLPLSGRRLGMIRRNILAILAVRNLSPATLAEAAEDVAYAVHHSIPHAAAGIEVRRAVVSSAHAIALGPDRVRAVPFHDDDPLVLARNYLRAADTLPLRRHHEVVTALEESLATASELRRAARALRAAASILRAAQDGRIAPPSDVVVRLAGLYAGAVRVRSDDDEKRTDWTRIHTAGGAAAEPDDLLALRLALHLRKDDDFHDALLEIREELQEVTR